MFVSVWLLNKITCVIVQVFVELIYINSLQ